MKYDIIINDYQESLLLKDKLNDELKKDQEFELSTSNPMIVFVIGGDGTFLKAVHKYQDHMLDANFCFVPIKSGSLNFYSTFDKQNFLLSLKFLKENKPKYYKKMELIEVELNNNMKYAINELKVVDHVKTLFTKIYVNDKLIQNFIGSGLVMATKSGSTGYMKSIQGSIIASELPLWELAEIAPLSNAIFSTIGSPLILDNSQIINLDGKLRDKSIIIDTYEYKLKVDQLTIKLSNQMLKVLVDPKKESSVSCRLNKMLTHNNKK